MSKKEFGELSPEPGPRLEQVIEGSIEELREIKEGVASGKFTPEQCIDVENKLRKLFFELSDGLRPDKELEPES